MSISPLWRRSAFTAATVGTLSLLGTGLASAHVTAKVYGEQPEKGGYGAIVLRVPNEEADAGTTKIELTVPAEYAITSARTKPVPGWSAHVRKTPLPQPQRNGRGAEVTEAVTKITWTAQPGTKIAAGSTEYQEFAISTGPLPSNVDELLLPAAQTYENGKVVHWDAPPPPDEAQEPEHPAPSVELAASTTGHGQGASASSTASESGGTDETARWLGGAGLVVGALGLGFGTGASLRARKARSGSASTSEESS